jgi:hypothetical protein
LHFSCVQGVFEPPAWKHGIDPAFGIGVGLPEPAHATEDNTNVGYANNMKCLNKDNEK